MYIDFEFQHIHALFNIHIKFMRNLVLNVCYQACPMCYAEIIGQS